MAYELTTPADLASVLSALGVRVPLTANTIYYVRKDGSDANDGLTNSAASAKLTIQGALNAASRIDLNSFSLKIKIGDGTYTERLLIPRMVGQKGTDQLLLEGNLTTPSNVVLQWGTNFAPVIEAIFGSLCSVSYFKIQHTGTNGFLLNAAEAGVINIQAGMEFGSCPSGYQIYSNNGGTINAFQPYTISGGGAAHAVAGYAGNMYISTIITISTAVTYTFGFLASISASAIQANGNTFINPGNVAGPRFACQKCGVIETFGAGASYLPGTTAGSVSGGGIYG